GSQPLHKKFKIICEINNMEVLKPILDVATRWNSSYEMVEWALKLQNMLDAIIHAKGDLNDNVLTKVE
ncbi:4432_t:CDS:1, partial [Dentiscutata erythropus]